MYIANPVYDLVFIEIMNDNNVAKKFISAIIGEEIIKLDFAYDEYTTRTREERVWTVFDFYFRAEIKTPDGYKVVYIELQKARYITDIIWFKRLQNKHDGEIYSIFILTSDRDMENTPPVLEVNQKVVRDIASGEEYTEKSEFIESLHFHSWIVQLESLKSNRRNDLEILLGIFDQNNRINFYSNYTLNIDEDNFPEKYLPIINRLRKLHETPQMEGRMNMENDYIEHLRISDWIIAEKNKQIAEAEKLIAERKKQIAEKNKQIV
ncbi:MAG: hypothetical protein LBT50_09705 [Prevotellaceae bacterium]|jgi:hypothetical protein|nr:hypothetical protein [Prevotellaceae bacterium]